MKKIYLLISLSITTCVVKAQCTVQVSGTNATCHGLSNGSATATPIGIPNYTYQWQPGGMTTASVSGLSPGTYTVTVVDATSCTSSGTITITAPAALNATTTQINVTCPGLCNGSATAFVTGGTSPYTHKWNTNPAQTNATASNLCAGTYNDSITDANGCKATLASPVTITQPPPFIAIVTCSGISCFGGSNGTATATQTGGTPGYSYSWSTTPAKTTKTITGLSPGTYSCTITDTSGCTAISSCTVNQPAAALSVTVTSSNASCSSCCNGSASSNVAGGTSAYTYSWSPGGQTTANITGLCAGNYTVCVTDANGCNTCNQTSVNFNTGINEITTYNNFRIYPNPTSGDFEIEVTASTAEIQFCLVDLLGSEIFSETVNATGTFRKKFSAQTLPAGIYFLRMKIEGKWTTQKLVKNNSQ